MNTSTSSGGFSPLPRLSPSLPIWAEFLLVVTSILLLLLARYLWKGYTSPLHALPGPKPAHWLLGDALRLLNTASGVVFTERLARYGHTFKYSLGFGGAPRLFTADLAAIAYIQRNPDLFIKPPDQTAILTRLLGRGVLMSEGDQHRRQRRILLPAFAPTVVRELVPVFLEKAYNLKDKLAAVIEDDAKREAAPTPADARDVVPGARKIDMGKFLTQITFDVIGVAGMDYDFKCLDNPNPIVQGFREALSTLTNMSVMAVLQVIIPALEVIPTKRVRMVDKMAARLKEVGDQLIDRKKHEVILSEGAIDSKTKFGKDLMSLIVRANNAKDIPESQRLSHEEISAQVATFLFAGSETSSTALGWCLFRLSQNPQFQTRLRDELFTLSDEPSFEQLNALPFLENVVRETLRRDPPVPHTVRQTTADCHLPTTIPVMIDGRPTNSIFLPKGTHLLGAIMHVHMDKAIWGEDADQFNPDRFNREGYPLQTVPSAYGNLLTFLGGPRNCIGYRFALAEIKAVLFVLLRSFEFAILPSKPEIMAKDYITMIPYVIGEEDAGSQMPLLVRPLE